MATRVQILLPTYNGERYLAEQIASLLKQDHTDTDILIRDDGSSDGTRDLLKDYGDHPRVRLVFGDNLGVPGSFFELLRISDPKADYVALCDQDDIWLPDKVSRALGFFTPADRDRPVAYASRVAVVDQDLRRLEMSRAPSRPLALGNSLVENMLPGCTIVLNRTARDLVVSRLPQFAFVHDWWIYLVMSACGEIRHDRESRILYRQHGRNAIGIAPNVFSKARRRVRGFLRRKESIVRQVAEFRRLFGDLLAPSQLQTVDMVLRSPGSAWLRLRLACSMRVYRQALADDLLLRLIIVANKL